MVAKTKTKITHEASEATRETFDQFFEDYFKRRREIYWLNFVRGIWFGLGSVIGGTLILAGILGLLSLFHQVPFLSGIVEIIQRSIEEARVQKL